RDLSSLFTDTKGRIWVTGFYGPGLMVAGGSEILVPPDGHWSTFPGYRTNAMAFMAEDGAGTLWMADSSRLISAPQGSEDPRTWGFHPLPSPWNNAHIIAVSAHRDGSIWVAMNVLMPAWTDLTARFDGKAWTVFDSLKSGE